MFQHPELLKWFKDFVGFREGSGAMGSGSEQAMSSSDSQRLRPERLIGDSAMEIGKYIVDIHSTLRLVGLRCHISSLKLNYFVF